MNARHLLLLGLTTLTVAACDRSPPPTDKDSDTTDDTTGDTTGETDVDTVDTDDTTVDTIPDTDDTTPDTDDTTPDTDAPWSGPGTLTTLPALRDGSGGFVAGSDLVAVRGVVVTAIGRLGFSVQDPNATEWGGIYVFVNGSFPAGLAEGDILDIAGDYEEYDNTSSGPSDTLAELVVLGGAATINVVGTGGVVNPVEIDLATLEDRAEAEKYESMLLTLRQPNRRLLVDSLPADNFGEFHVTAVDQAHRQLIDQEYLDLGQGSWGANIATLDVGDAFDTITGVLHYSFDAYKVAPRTIADVSGYLDNPTTPLDTGSDTGDTDTGSDTGDTDTGDTDTDTAADTDTGDTDPDTDVDTGDTDPDTDTDTDTDTLPDTATP